MTTGAVSASESSFSKALRVLKLVVAEGEVRVDTVSRSLQLPQTTCRRLLRLLEDSGFVEERRGVYTQGPLLRHELNPVINPATIATISEASAPALEFLRDQTGETALCVVRSGLHGIVLREVRSLSMLRVDHRRGQVMPLHAGAAQRVLLAFASPDVLQSLISRGLPRLTNATPTERDLLTRLELVRNNGFAMSTGEIIPDTVAMAVPGTVGGEVVCALSVTGPASRCDRQWQTTALQALRYSARMMREMVVF